MKGLDCKVERSIELIRKMEHVALDYSEDGFHVAFSGGKDSQVLLELVKRAGVKYKAHMQVTTLDPPELMKFIRRVYPDVELHHPELNFCQLIEKKKMLPRRNARFCCKYLKEMAGGGTVTLIGIRAQESAKRAKRNVVEVSGRKFSGTLDQFNVYRESVIKCIGGKDQILVSPIFDWTEREVWLFILGEKLEYCRLYDEGYKRIGCIFCCMADKRSKLRDKKNYPQVERAITKVIQKMIDENGFGSKYGLTASEIFDWYISNESMGSWYAENKQQLRLPGWGDDSRLAA